MKIASHNTLSYRSPLQWWLKPLAFIGRCQSKPIHQQFKEGVRVFDLRIRQEKTGSLVIAHNAFVYVSGINAITALLEWLDTEAKYTKEKVYVRLLHEVRNDEQLRYSPIGTFQWFCERVVFDYPHITFFGGQRTMDWQQDYSFNTNIEYIERHASVRWPKWLHWWPWLYAKMYNGCNRRMMKDKDIIVFTDFL